MTGDFAAPTQPVVGIGASAGGLQALTEFVSRLSPDTGACYVIVQHLSPDQNSIMDQLLQPNARLPVSQIKSGEEVTANHIYIVPPGHLLELQDDHFHLTERDTSEHLHRPIDHFFSSLAQTKGRDAYCVVLSGTGSDGADGVKRVKAGGGFALVQESQGARFPGMPDSAVATGLVDFVLPVGDIPGRLQDIMAHRGNLRNERLRERLRHDVEASLETIAERLSEVSGNDFSSYKPGTLVRRIERRMSLLRVESVKRFLSILKDDQQQAELLAQEFLIGVTQFFRDAEAFEQLRERVIAPLVARDQRNIRIWVPGCSTGEEVYSIAMLFMEEMDRQDRHHVLQVFGTDIDMPALVNARHGNFSTPAVEALGKERRERFFTASNGRYRAISTLRESCVFAPHNLVQDPPFSRLDLISCRNLMIYLSAQLQSQVIPRFHFSLRDGGHLFLGPSENIAGEDKLFDVVDKKNKIFKRNSDAQTRYSALRDPVPKVRSSSPSRLAEAGFSPSHASEVALDVLAEREFLRQHAAPFALISEDGNIEFLSQRMADFVRPAPGTPSNAIDAYLVRELRVPVRSALAEAVESGRIARMQDVLVERDDKLTSYDISVSPLQDESQHYLLSLDTVRRIETGSLSQAVERREQADRDMLETENFSLRRQLSAALQEYETSGQELKSSNEELLSMNEELQSSNEELETSREELQSINEELETVNAELQENNRQLTRANSDLKNLFESTDIAVLFLDRNFCVRNFTPATSDLFGIRARDIGRPILDLSWRVDYPSLHDDARQVDETLQPLEREVQVKASGETFLLRVKPYRTTENLIDGYVLSFVDITSRKNFEETLRRNEEDLARQYGELENLYDTTPVGLALVNRSYEWLRINETLAAINGYSVQEHQGKNHDQLLPDIAEIVEGIFDRVFETGEPVLGIEISGQTPASPGATRYWIGDFYPVRSNGEVFAVGVCVREVTEQAKMVEEIRQQNSRQKILLGELQHRVKNTLATISAVAKMLSRPGDSPQEFRRRFLERLAAISRTHDLLTDADWREVSLFDVLRKDLRPYEGKDGDLLNLTGPDLLLSPQQAMALGMATHELTTNSAKYGAISADGGRIDVQTRVDDRDDTRHVTIRWVERGGPKISAPPKTKGFGSVMIEDVLASDLGGQVAVEYAPDGLVVEIKFSDPRLETA
ncbi:PAS domain S-box protein [Salipiger sp. IMCC34102]|uniref:chemotaxis protein CheB n=1 Tax=Salipiger sp. IMCC34102 TaxID=2510647 RepID=UPI00101D370D|nr:chemotaxis protein CheB [Salipiger sp. IMCC34102]RYH00995.1 PAS domain S-box protein [Salipiger sp. IMCC34102]